MKLFNAENIRNRTAEARGDYALTDPVDGYSRKAHEIAAIVDKSDFGCQQQNVRDLVAALIGEALPLPTPKSDDKYVLGSVIEFRGDLYLVRLLDGDGDCRVIDAYGSTRIDGLDYLGENKGSPASAEQVEKFLIDSGIIDAPAA